MEDTARDPLSFLPPMDNARKTILASGKKVAAARFGKSMTQEDFRKASGASIDLITHFEPCEAAPILLRTAKRLAKGLGMEIEEFRDKFEIKGLALQQYLQSKADGREIPKKAARKKP